jgi:hypothetical protein
MAPLIPRMISDCRHVWDHPYVASKPCSWWRDRSADTTPVDDVIEVPIFLRASSNKVEFKRHQIEFNVYKIKNLLRKPISETSSRKAVLTVFRMASGFSVSDRRPFRRFPHLKKKNNPNIYGKFRALSYQGCRGFEQYPLHSRLRRPN